MSLTAAAIETLIAKGLSSADILDVARAMETQPKRSPGAERQARYRANKEAESVTCDVTRDAPPPPNDNISNPPPVPITDVIGDPEKIIFSHGIRFLVAAGVSEQKARSLLGKWKRDHGAAETIVALGRAQREGAIEPVAFIGGCLRQHARQQAPPVWDGMP